MEAGIPAPCAIYVYGGIIMFDVILENVREKTPLVHCTANYVTVNDVANAILVCSGSPIMADDENDAVDITAICDALVINIGTLNERTIATTIKTGRKAIDAISKMDAKTLKGGMKIEVR